MAISPSMIRIGMLLALRSRSFSGLPINSDLVAVAVSSAVSAVSSLLVVSPVVIFFFLLSLPFVSIRIIFFRLHEFVD